MKQAELDLLNDLAVLVRDITQFVATAITAERQGETYPHWPGDEARVGTSLVVVGQRLQARLTDATAEAPPETLELVRALRAVDAHIEPVAAALFAGTIPAEKQYEFAGLLSSVSELLHEHAAAMSRPAPNERRQKLATYLRTTDHSPRP